MFQNSWEIRILPCLKATDFRSLPMNAPLGRTCSWRAARSVPDLEISTGSRQSIVWPSSHLPSLAARCQPSDQVFAGGLVTDLPTAIRSGVPRTPPGPHSMRNGVPGETKHRLRLCAFSVALWVEFDG